jgi:hypothetical protein
MGALFRVQPPMTDDEIWALEERLWLAGPIVYETNLTRLA